MGNSKPTLCWDCANYAKGCNWSECFKPVKGWEAVPTKTMHFDSYIVYECPKFKRDAYNAGMYRMDNKKITVTTDARERPSKAQMKYIQWIQDNADRRIPVFDGNTAEDAKQYIVKYRKYVPVKQLEVNLFEKVDKRKLRGLA